MGPSDETFLFNRYIDSYYNYYCKTRKERYIGMDSRWEELLKEASDYKLDRIRTRAELKMAHREQLKNFDKETKTIESSCRKAVERYVDEIIRSGGCNPAEQKVESEE